MMNWKLVQYWRSGETAIISRFSCVLILVARQDMESCRSGQDANSWRSEAAVSWTTDWEPGTGFTLAGVANSGADWESAGDQEQVSAKKPTGNLEHAWCTPRPLRDRQNVDRDGLLRNSPQLKKKQDVGRESRPKNDLEASGLAGRFVASRLEASQPGVRLVASLLGARMLEDS